MTKSATTVFLYVKTGGNNSIRLRDRPAVTAPSDDESCYEVCTSNYHRLLQLNRQLFLSTKIRSIFHLFGFCVFRKICRECSHFDEEQNFIKNRNVTATSVTFSFMKDEWNAFTIDWDYVENRMWLGQKDVDWPVIQFSEFPSDTLIKPIRYFGIRTDRELFEDFSHWIIGLGT